MAAEIFVQDYLYADRRGKPLLVLDLMEEVVDRTLTGFLTNTRESDVCQGCRDG